MQAEAINNLMLGICKRLEVDPAFYGSPPFLAATVDADGLTLAAVMTPPHNLILYTLASMWMRNWNCWGTFISTAYFPAGRAGPVALASAFCIALV
jgi:hypothetical protein